MQQVSTGSKEPVFDGVNRYRITANGRGARKNWHDMKCQPVMAAQESGRNLRPVSPHLCDVIGLEHCKRCIRMRMFRRRSA